MPTGAVVMIDALGFKGIWNRIDPEKAVAKMRSMQMKAREGVSLHEHTASSSSAFLSDTIVFGIAPTSLFESAGARNASTILLAAFHVLDVIGLALQDEPLLSYRGCITFGSFLIDGSFVIGAAVDEAAEHYEQAEGAFVWLAPSARAVWDVAKRRLDPPDTHIVPYAIPLKGGARYQSYAVSPFDTAAESDERQSVRSKLLSTFDVGQGSTSLAVQIKRQNTEKFLAWLAKPGHQGQRRGGPWLNLTEDLNE